MLRVPCVPAKIAGSTAGAFPAKPTNSSDAQPSKSPAPSSRATEAGKTTEERRTAPRKAFVPTLSSASGRRTARRRKHPSKASGPMRVAVVVIETDSFRAGQPISVETSLS